MYQINFNKPVKIHFMGIGGISMSGLAEILHAKGFTVVGSDAHESAITDHLTSLGIQIAYGQRAENITPDIDVVVYTAAIHPDNPEFAAAKSAGLPMMDRAELLGQIMTNYTNAIAVSGTNSFLKFNPSLEIILNIEEDHLDFFKDINDIRHSFRKFAEKLDADDILVINGEISNVSEITDGLPCHIITYGLKPECDYAAENITFDEFAKGSFDLIAYGKKIDHIQLNVAGIHNVSNALAAIASARELHIPMDIIKKGLMAFEGTDRRFEYKGQFNGVTVIDDYAHHPTEIKATLTAAQKYPHRQIWCVFQPHTYTRTKAFFHEFADALSLADKIVLADIYAARETDPGDIHSRDIQKLLLEKGKEAYYFPSFEEIEKFLREKCINGDLLITMGAGDVVLVGEALIK